MLRDACLKIVIILGFLGIGVTSSQCGQFNYLYGTEIAWNDQRGKMLPSPIISFAEKHFAHLNNTLFFQPSIIKNAHKARKHHLRNHYKSERKGELIEYKTDDGIIIHGTYFNRNSDKLLVVGEGFTNTREIMSPFIEMFPSYDIVLFDFRGHGLESKNFSLSKRLIGVDLRKVGLGNIEELDVFAVIDGMKQRKKYTKIFGLGICYSAFIFLKAASLKKHLFDKLIIDGCWVSLPLIIEKIRKDPKLLCNPQRGGWSKHSILSSVWIQDIFMWIAINILGISLHHISLLDYVHTLEETEVLFFHAKDDLMIDKSEFEAIWNSITIPKLAVITSNTHVRNHFAQKELYRLICELFFQYDHQFLWNLLNDGSCKKIASLYSNQVLNFDA